MIRRILTCLRDKASVRRLSCSAERTAKGSRDTGQELQRPVRLDRFCRIRRRRSDISRPGATPEPGRTAGWPWRALLPTGGSEHKRCAKAGHRYGSAARSRLHRLFPTRRTQPRVVIQSQSMVGNRSQDDWCSATQGFNPGNRHPEWRALKLKGRQIEHTNNAKAGSKLSHVSIAHSNFCAAIGARFIWSASRPFRANSFILRALRVETLG
jgi:hypothetical protein